MAIDKAVDSSVLNAGLTSIANAIRTKGGTSAQLVFPADFVQAINDIQTDPGTVSIVVYGAKNEVVTYSGAASGSITLNASGVGGAADLPKGQYAFTGGVSGWITSVNLTADSEVYVRPRNCLYWYGAELTQTTTYRQSGTSFTTQANKIALTWSGSTAGGTAAAGYGTVNTIDVTAYSTVKMRTSITRQYDANRGVEFGLTDGEIVHASTITPSTLYKTMAVGDASVDISSVTGEKRVILKSSLASFDLYGLWLE